MASFAAHARNLKGRIPHSFDIPSAFLPHSASELRGGLGEPRVNDTKSISNMPNVEGGMGKRQLARAERCD